MTRFTKWRRVLLPAALASTLVASGIAFASSAQATEPTTGPAIVITDDNFDLSDAASAPNARRSEPVIVWCGDKQPPKGPDKPGDKPVDILPVPELTAAKIIGEEPGNGDDKGDGPKGHPSEKPCFNKPRVVIDDENCCKNPQLGGKVTIKYLNENKTALPQQLTVDPVGHKPHTVSFWIKPGYSKVVIHKIPNGKYVVTAHLLKHVFAKKFIKVKCEVKPTPTTPSTTSPTTTPTTTPTTAPTTAPTVEPTPDQTTTTPVPGTGGGNNTGGNGELALTGSSGSLLWGGGGLVALGAVILIAFALIRRRRDGDGATQFVAE